MEFIYDECENCGMTEVQLVNGYCPGCICQSCNKNAGETGCSMNEVGWCTKCWESNRALLLASTAKYHNQCPCGIAATDCTYHH